MTALAPISAEEKSLIEALVDQYKAEGHKYKILHDALATLVEWPKLVELMHSYRLRLKDPGHLRDKLERKMRKAAENGEPFGITSDNLFTTINDLAGLRILHLYTRQVGDIDREIRAALEEQELPLVEGPFARTWDDESRKYFTDLGIETRQSGDSMYTSVHYVIEANTKTKLTGEIQVRTLAEELWGEVDHMINYPHQNPKATCREQIRVLARATSTCSRLVDSIFTAHNE